MLVLIKNNLNYLKDSIFKFFLRSIIDFYFFTNLSRLKKEQITLQLKVSVEEYLNKISPYLKDIINNLKKSDTWKIQLTIAN